MALGILGKKIGMTQVFDDKGRQFPVTVLRVGPNPILLVRDKDHDGVPQAWDHNDRNPYVR